MDKVNIVKPNEAYFRRNSGEWRWNAHFSILSWSGLFSSPVIAVHKARIVAMILSQYIIGHYSMWTRVVFDEKRSVVLHSTRFTKWGFLFYRSEKQFHLSSDGQDLLLEGKEFYWPFLNSPISFDECRGRVDASTTAASYQMPLFGLKFFCQTFLGKGQGSIQFDSAWMRAQFTLDENSMRTLQGRLG